MYKITYEDRCVIEKVENMKQNRLILSPNRYAVDTNIAKGKSIILKYLTLLKNS